MRKKVIYTKEKEIKEIQAQIKDLQEQITKLRAFRKCNYCGKEYIAVGRKSRTMYCSVECKVHSQVEQIIENQNKKLKQH